MRKPSGIGSNDLRFGRSFSADLDFHQREVCTKAGCAGSQNPYRAMSALEGKRIRADTWGAAPSKPGTTGTSGSASGTA